MKIGGVVVLVQGPGETRPYSQVRDTALAAEQAGFDSVWLYDHLLYRNEGEPTTGIWECWTTLSALAEATQRVELGSLVACSQFRNPAILAKMATTLNEVSDGRLDEVGRDPAAIGVTTVLKVGWPDLGELPSFFENECLTGSSEEIAAAFRAYDDSGVSHIMCHYAPDGPKALGRLGEAMRVYRAG